MPVLKIKKSDGTWQEVWGALNDTSSTVSKPKLATITISASKWGGSTSPYSQVVSVNGVNANSKLDLQPTPNIIASLQDSETSLMLTNNNGVVTAWAIGNKPTENYTVDVLITEVTIV